MRLLFRAVIDYAAIVSVGLLASPHGMAWALLAMIAVCVYSAWCFWDGGSIR
jgi:hypothetical protein